MFNIYTGREEIKGADLISNTARPGPEKTFKIAILGTFPPLRGLSSYCLDLAVSLINILSIEFISFKKLYPATLYPGKKLEDDVTFPPIHHPRLKVHRRLTWYNPLTWLTQAFHTQAELLHAQWWSLPLFPVFLLICSGFRIRGKPVIFTVHNVLSHEKSNTYRLLSKILFLLGNHFVVHTLSAKKQLKCIYGIATGKISVIPHGLLDFHVNHDMDPHQIRKELGFSAKHKIILLFGAIRPYKGIDIALKALAKVSMKCPDIRMLIAGKLWENWAPYQALIKKMDIEAQVVTCLDYIPAGEVYRYFTAADIVVLPYSHFDSQSGVASTAVSFRKPLIVSDVGGLPDLVPDKRFVVPPNNPDALANAILLCLKHYGNPERLLIDLEQITTGLSSSAIAEKTVAAYCKVLHRS